MRHALTAALAALLAAAAVAGQPANLLANPGFEDGTTGWTLDPKHERLTEPGAAHTGTACVTGEIASKSKHLTLACKVKVAAGNLYKVEIWARATNGTRMALWAVMPRQRRKQLVSAWNGIPAKWRKYSATLTATRGGLLELQLVAPSSWGAPPGRIWLDDLAVLETAMAPMLSVSKGIGFNDAPTLARAADGSLTVAWLSFRRFEPAPKGKPKTELDGADSLQLARYVPQAKGLQEAGAWQVVGGKGTYVLGPRLVPAGDRVALVYAAEVDRNWDIYAATCGPDGPGAPVAVTSHAAVDIKPAAAWHEGTLWLAWESNRDGCRQIFAASLRDGKPSAPVAVSAAGASSYDPAIAVLGNGEVCVAWHCFRDNNYDIALRRRAADGTWKPERRLTRAPTIDRNALLLARGDELWLLYENASTERYHVGRANRRRIMLAKVAPQGLLAPKGYAKASPLYGARCEAPTAAFDPSGRLWLAFLKPRLPRSGWDVFVTCFNGKQWQPPMALSTRKGMDCRPGLALAGDRAVVAIQADDLPRTWSEVGRTMQAESHIYLATVGLKGQEGKGTVPLPEGTVPFPHFQKGTVPSGRGTVPLELVPLVEPPEPFEAGKLRVARGEDLPTPSTTYRGQKLHLYFGDLHEHTDISVCNRVGDMSVDESYQAMRDLARHDFACCTDHGYNINPHLWNTLAKLARVNDDPGRFLTFLGEEWTSSFEKYSAKHPYGYYGHRNLVFADLYFPRWWDSKNAQTPAQVWEDLRKMKANFVHIPHQLADTGNVPVDWDFADETAQPVAEMFQTRGSYEFKGTLREAKRSTPKKGYFLQDAWARGIVIGVIASPDHGGGYGKAAVWAPELTREAILDALRARRCYGTTAAKIVLDVRVDGHLMGEKVAEPAGETVKVEIRVRAPVAIKTIEVCRNNQFVYTHTPKNPPGGSQPPGGSRSAELTFVDRAPLPGRSYYYVRVIQADDEIAWSSPVWLGAK